MADLKTVEAAFLKADAAGDTEAARALAGEVRRLRAAGPAASAPAGGSDREPTGSLAAVGAGLGKGFGQVALNVQKLAGKGLGAVGAERAGRWLQDDAQQGLARIESEAAPYKADHPVLVGAGELGGNLVATAPVGGVLARGAAAIPGVATAAPGLVNAIRTSGMSTGQVGGNALANLAMRSAGGAITGGASAALVNPDDAAFGAGVGAVLPAALQVVGKAGNKIGNLVRGPEQPADLAAAVAAARESGYVIPPTQARASLGNRLLEGFSGKLTTAQNASAKNQAVTNAKAAAAIGLPEDTVITPDALDAVRKEAGKAYAAVSRLGRFDATRADLPASVRVEESISPLLAGKTKSVDAGEVVRAWRQANADATAYYRAYGRDANPETLAKAKAAATEAKRIDEFLVKEVQASQKKAPGQLIADLAAGRLDQQAFLQRTLELGQRGDLAQNLKDARVLIAKTHSVEDALNAATGTIDARKLAKQLQKGKPLSGELKDIAEFSGRFPKASQTIEGMGSLPQTSPLDWMAGGTLSAATANPLLLASALARPAARSATLSPLVQDRLVQGPAGNALSRLASPEVRRGLYRAAPLTLSDR